MKGGSQILLPEWGKVGSNLDLRATVGLYTRNWIKALEIIQ